MSSLTLRRLVFVSFIRLPSTSANEALFWRRPFIYVVVQFIYYTYLRGCEAARADGISVAHYERILVTLQRAAVVAA